MSKKKGPAHVVVDGSNIATEGRSMPSLSQLNDAVTSFMEEHPDAAITVVVDATFGHRIDKSEAKEFDAGISNNELVAPPAGAVGRGDAFVLGIADKANATVLSNDSFQEFHGEYDWLFDEGRLIGGKPVPHVGWVFVDRVPVRGPVSRKATRSTRSKSTKSAASRREVDDHDGDRLAELHQRPSAAWRRIGHEPQRHVAPDPFVADRHVRAVRGIRVDGSVHAGADGVVLDELEERDQLVDRVLRTRRRPARCGCRLLGRRRCARRRRAGHRHRLAGGLR